MNPETPPDPTRDPEAGPTGPNPRRPGWFFALDGPDGGGKTTQVAALADWLRGRGYEVLTCRDPGGTPLGDRLRAILLDRSTVGLSLRAEMLLYMASRAQLVEEVVGPALASGKVVVSDRYLLANVVYQGYAGGLGVDDLIGVGRVATSGLLPDLTIVLDVPPEVARSRTEGRGGAPDRIEARPEGYHARVREGFLLASGPLGVYPVPVVRVDASGDPGDVAERIRNEVGRALAVDPRP